MNSALISRLLLSVAATVPLCAPVFALNPERQVSQYAHTAWRMQDGAFSGIPSVITQTTDGYLWIGTNIGLLYFNGVSFLPLNPPAGERLLDSRIFSLLGARDGSLWIGTGYSVSRWKDGHLLNFPQLSGRIEALVEDNEGSIWLARTQATDTAGPVCRIKQERLRCYGVQDGLPFPNALQLANSGPGELWVVGYSELCRWKPGSCQVSFPNTSRRPEGFALFRTIANGPDGSTWTVLDRPRPPLRLEHFADGKWTSVAFPQIPADNSEITTVFADCENAIWVGTARQGVFRIQGDRVEHLGSADGLSSDSIERFYEDAEGTLWIVTSSGVDDLRDLRVATYSLREGVTVASTVAVLASRDGSLWINDNYRALDILRGNKLISISANHGLPGKHVTTFYEDLAGRLWLGIDSDLYVYDRGSFRVIHRPDGSSMGIVFALTEDIYHNIWVRAGPNLDRVEDFTVRQETTSSQIATSYILAAMPDGGVVLGLVNGDLVEFHNGGTRVIPSNEAGHTRQIRDLLVQSDGSVWGTTLDELFRTKDGVRRNLTVRNGLPCDGIFALVEDNSGAIWLYSKCGLIQIEKSELDRWWQHPAVKVNVRLLDEFDGVQPGLTSLKPQATRSPDGRLWFADGRFLQMLDPRHLGRNLRPPPVHIEEVVADQHSYSPRVGLRLPPLTRDLEINYAALSFVAPRKVRFRYRLNGYDLQWREPGTRREAVYNDLRPGQYSFRVLASNNDGVWNEAGAAFNFAVAPAFYQTAWFKLLIFGAAAGLLWLAYLYRLKHLTARIQERLAAQLEERERIARELHDTLLQGFHGLMLRFQAVLKTIPPGDPTHQMLEQALVRGDDVLLEGRQRVQGIRDEGLSGDGLPEKLALCGEELARYGDTRFSLIVVGTPHSLEPAVSNEAYRIGREALVNAFRHAQANSIEAEITYDRSKLRVTVRDDGAGIDELILDRGRSGHWGLSGMRERAGKIGAQMKIWSRVGAGTEIDLTIPASIAYPRSSSRSVWKRRRSNSPHRDKVEKS